MRISRNPMRGFAVRVAGSSAALLLALAGAATALAADPTAYVANSDTFVSTINTAIEPPVEGPRVPLNLAR